MRKLIGFFEDTYHRDFARTSARDREYDRARRVERPARFNRGGYDDGDDDYRHSRDYDIDDTGLTRPAHRSSSRGDRYSEYRGKDHEKYAPYSYKGPLNLGGPPNREIMMTDLAPYMNEDDVGHLLRFLDSSSIYEFLAILWRNLVPG